MPFVYKESTQDEANRQEALSRGPAIYFQRTYAIDEARNILLLNLGKATTAREDTSVEYYNLIVDGQAVAFEANSLPVKEDDLWIREFKVTSVSVPAGLQLTSDAIARVFGEALSAYCSGLYRKQVPVRVLMPDVIRRVESISQH